MPGTPRFKPTDELLDTFARAFAAWNLERDMAVEGAPQTGGVDLVWVEEGDTYWAFLKEVFGEDPERDPRYSAWHRQMYREYSTLAQQTVGESRRRRR
jgi:hypothetical protein